jgi:hypothetical protein
MSDYVEVPQGEGLDPEEFKPIVVQRPKPEDLSQEDDREASKPVPKRKAEKILKEAKERFQACKEWESYTRRLNLDDLKFVEADSDNGYQWPNDILKARDADQRPSLTINKTRQHCLMIINDCKQNKPTVKIRAVGGGATYQSAQVLEGLIRHIEYQSNASTAYDTATEFQVKIGIGYWRVVTDYVSDDSFDQEIFIRRIRDPFSVYLDPDILEVDGSDARFAFIFEDIPKSEFDRLYPKWKNKISAHGAGLESTDNWVSDKHVRVAEYFRRVEREEELLSIVVPETGERTIVKASDLSPEIVAQIKSDPRTRTRTATKYDVEWYLIAGDEVLETKIWPGIYIPIVRVIGEETIIERRLDRKGHVRALKDPQRMYNYWSSSAVENVALQSKTPYIGAAEAIEGYETYYETANRVNHAFLPYNAYDDQGRKLDPPRRQEPVQMPQAYIQGLMVSNQEMMAVSGQYEATLGDKGDEKTGIAIQERQRTGHKATYHYIDNLATGIRFTGKILLDLIPKIYDTPRVLRILSEDGTESQIQIDPLQKQALVENGTPNPQQAAKQMVVQKILNPSIGRYEVQADVGPNYATRRQEAFNAFAQIISQRPELVQLIGDILLKAGDFPMADEAAERLKRMVPLQALGEAPPPEVLALQQQVENLKASLAISIQELANKTSEIKAQQEQKAIEAYKAETDRLSKLLSIINDPVALGEIIKPILAKLLVEMQNDNMQAVKNTARAFLDPPLVPPGVSQALGQQPPPLAQPLIDNLNNLEDGGQGIQDSSGVPSALGEPSGQNVQDLSQPLGSVNEYVPNIQPATFPQAIEGLREGKSMIPDPDNPGQFLQVGS